MNIWSVQKLRDFDAFCIKELNIPGIILMENAGLHSAGVIMADYPDIKKALIICGKGNNAGDGFVVARHLMNSGVKVDILSVFPDEKISADAQVFHDTIDNYKIQKCSHEDDLKGYDIIVDAVFGIGFHGELPVKVSELFDVINNIDCHKVALDIPSGVQADDCIADVNAFRADKTITMVAVKKSFVHDFIQGITGDIIVVPIGVEPCLFECRLVK